MTTMTTMAMGAAKRALGTRTKAVLSSPDKKRKLRKEIGGLAHSMVSPALLVGTGFLYGKGWKMAAYITLGTWFALPLIASFVEKLYEEDEVEEVYEDEEEEDDEESANAA